MKIAFQTRDAWYSVRKLSLKRDKLELSKYGKGLGIKLETPFTGIKSLLVEIKSDPSLSNWIDTCLSGYPLPVYFYLKAGDEEYGMIMTIKEIRTFKRFVRMELMPCSTMENADALEKDLASKGNNFPSMRITP